MAKSPRSPGGGFFLPAVDRAASLQGDRLPELATLGGPRASEGFFLGRALWRFVAVVTALPFGSTLGC